ncbi:hypothetical protein TNCV_1928081 [Trichonephila clavipes]|nr:hypothetical protein TNCV_1928081 [Trichonephila clavipes]
MTSCLNFSAASAHSCTIHSCSYKPADIGESCRSSRSSHGGDANCGLRRIFQWTFLVGNVSTPIIGADFLYNSRLVPDISISSNSNPDDVHKSAIITPFGLFESTRMQFGLCNAAATFQRFIDEVLRNLPFVFAFVDDILVASSSPEEHLQHLQILFTRLQQYGLSLKPSKCISV